MNPPAPDAIHALMAKADELSARGQSQAAASLWQQVLDLSPGFPPALNHLGAQAMMRGELAVARDCFTRAIAGQPNFVMAHANLSRMYSLQGDRKAALKAIQDAITADPTAWGPHFEKARLLEADGCTRQAAMSWSSALAYIPDAVANSPHAQEWVKQAHDAIKQNQSDLHAFLAQRVDLAQHRQNPREVERFEHCLDIVTGRRPFVTARPLMVPFPRLPAIPFFHRDDFPWTAEVESAFPDMLQELQQLIAQQREFEPYVQTAAGEPSAQFAALDNNLAWGAYFLWKNGTRIDAHADLCPRTEAAIARAPQNSVPGRAPVLFFSALKPGTHIPPHNGATNTRLTVHMPLIIPPDCALRVGDETRTWEPGKLLLFDDTIRHEAWNFSKQLRVVLIFDVWHPMLTELERDLVSQTVQGMMAFYGDDADLGEL